MPSHPANRPFTVEVSDAHPQVEVTRSRSRSNAVLRTTMLFRSSQKSETRIMTEGAEKVRVAVTGPEATSMGIPTFGERTSITVSHRDVNYALQQAKERPSCQPVCFVTIAPIPEHEVLPSPAGPAITLPVTSRCRKESGKSIEGDSEGVDHRFFSKASASERDDDEVERAMSLLHREKDDSDDEYSLIPPDPFAALESEGVERKHKSSPVEAWAEEVARKCEEEKNLRKKRSRPVGLNIDTSSVRFPSQYSPASTESVSIPERPSAPEPLSPGDDDSDGSFSPNLARPTAPEPTSPTSSCVDESVTRVADTTESTASLPTALRTLKTKTATPNLRAGYVGGAELTRSRKSSATSSKSAKKRRFPVIKAILGGKSHPTTPTTPLGEVNSEITLKATKGMKRSRDDDEENISPDAEKAKRVIKGRNIRRKVNA